MSLDCIPYINDLKVEIEVLKNLMNDKDESSKKEILNMIKVKECLIDKCIKNLKKLSNNQICYRIYLNILSGLSVNQAIEKVAQENYLNNVKPATETSLYRDYYRKVKDIIRIK